MSNYFFTSDTHFNNNEIIKRENRPFKNSRQQDRFIIKTWNKQIQKDDIIFVIGDFVNCNKLDTQSWEKALKYVKQIKCKVVLIIGNNENILIKLFFDNDFEKFRNYCIELGFFDVKTDEILNFNGKNFYLNHEPKNHKNDYINLFGHVHRATGLWKPFGINVGVDLNYFRLHSMRDIKSLLDIKKEYWDKDINNNAM